MPVLESVNEREFRDGAALTALSRVGGALLGLERSSVLGPVETLRRDAAEIPRFARLADTSMHQLGIAVSDYRPLAGTASAVQDAVRGINEPEATPKDKPCADDPRAVDARRSLRARAAFAHRSRQPRAAPGSWPTQGRSCAPRDNETARHLNLR